MEVTGHLVEPKLEPCPCSGEGRPPAKREPDWSGWDCCKFYDKNNVWCNDVVRVDHINPERFHYDKFRYQMYAKPRGEQCTAEKAMNTAYAKSRQTKNQNGGYIPATTDVRALEQTMFVPVVPSNPGGETDYTFPMTAKTMGQPDITSACCVPVIPSQPGFKNLTPGILPGPCSELNRTRGVAKASQAGCPCMGDLGAMSAPCAPQFMAPPSNVPGSYVMGLPDTFPKVKNEGPRGYPTSTSCSYASAMNSVPTMQLPNYDGSMGHGGLAQGCSGGFDIDEFDDGMPDRKQCTNTKMVRYDERVRRAVSAKQETAAEWGARLHTMFGSYGSCIVAQPMNRRHLPGPKDSITTQGNGFQVDYPKHPNRQCYFLERNTRC